MARPFTQLPVGAKSHLEAMAQAGLLSESASAASLGMPLDQFRRVIAEHKPSKAVWENAMSIERDNLLQALYSKALDGDTRAAQTLLAVRHGMSEKVPQSPGPGVSIVFQLPAAVSADEWLKSLQVQPKQPEALAHDNAGN